MNLTSAVEVDLVDKDAYFTGEPCYYEKSFIVSQVVSPIKIGMIHVQVIEYQIESKKGLLAAIGAWEEFDNIDEFVEDIYRKRGQSFDRSVDL
ncbi:MAG: hypothetical protein A3G39_01600 [Deltaproteobacteria bacterium RIFCSPLOWO2_12_FULL_43_16]|nr:MAG: hypothetical protein A2Z89_09495 [Deltaproteobacteria bacterium GWA2_43_19]OGQ09547.1 MAG: hypothetical protein A3D30_05005 [Deltaproteobacteria bacterium RIFCSPHIGHO2_02_FULL_43_33]OGQ36260.1 MAG: hypothetical protein A3A85_04500 [Deltaproteobacteria bacterium RIFCSPLOWO2_01_FULL_42_9]OGQ58559.1 MAG: hypothetical protein A3G39_01600 [Deltaproteobacteria bacterium RIFCSPLOWO2_12_FULL_43_16]HBR18295.1 hypothetical protein [Deltaproteobacteria bacterium]